MNDRRLVRVDSIEGATNSMVEVGMLVYRTPRGLTLAQPGAEAPYGEIMACHFPGFSVLRFTDKQRREWGKP